MNTFQPELNKLKIKDTAGQWYFPPTEYKDINGNSVSPFYYWVYKNK